MTKDEPAGQGEDMNKVKEIDKGYKGPVITKEKENPNEAKAKYQAETGVVSDFGQAKNGT